MLENLEEEDIGVVKEMFPVLKYQTYLKPYFIKEEDATTEKGKERIRKTQRTILKQLKKNTLKSLEGKTAKTRNIRPANDKEKRRFKNATKGLVTSFVHRMRTRILQYGTPIFKEGYLRDVGVKVGKHVMLGGFNVFDTVFPELLTIGDEVLFGNGTVISCHQLIDGELYVGPVSIGENTLIGAGTFILPGVSVGKNSVVVPSFLGFDVPDNHFAIGMPEEILFELKGGSRIVKEKRDVQKTGYTIWDWKQIVDPIEFAWKNLWMGIQQSPFIPHALRLRILKYIGMKIGKNVHVDPGVIFDQYWPEKIEIGDGATIRKNSFIAAHEGIPGQFRTGKVKIGKNVLIETGVGILPGVEIKDDAEVMPYTFVASNVKEEEQVEGIPARKSGETFNIENFVRQYFAYTADTWEEIQKSKKKKESS
jgi:acetyltransferase-like isoleucine patch superfamily enzyme